MRQEQETPAIPTLEVVTAAPDETAEREETATEALAADSKQKLKYHCKVCGKAC